jgi:hypothetical protein
MIGIRITVPRRRAAIVQYEKLDVDGISRKGR